MTDDSSEDLDILETIEQDGLDAVLQRRDVIEAEERHRSEHSAELPEDHPWAGIPMAEWPVSPPPVDQMLA